MGLCVSCGCVRWGLCAVVPAVVGLVVGSHLRLPPVVGSSGGCSSVVSGSPVPRAGWLSCSQLCKELKIPL